MRTVPPAMTAAWEAEDKTGPRRPTVRATIQKVYLHRYDYDTRRSPGGDFEAQRRRKGSFRSLLMNQPSPVVELPNILSCSWTRAVTQDVAECTLTLLNAEALALGLVDADPSDFEHTAAYLPTNPGPWAGLIVPDRLVRTYEGYGADYAQVPGRDPNLMPSGTWLIDEVTYTEDGRIEIKMRDVGRLLLDQIAFPPLVSVAEYPMDWSKIRSEQVPGRDAAGGSWRKLSRSSGTASSSNDAYIGKGLTNAPHAHYVTSNGGVNGHHASHVLDNSHQAYWLSTGQRSFWHDVWWEIDLADATTALNALRLRAKGGPYRVYISLHNGTRWLGKKRIPYDAPDPTAPDPPEKPADVDIGAGIPFVASLIADANLNEEVVLPRKYSSIGKIRLTFRRLNDTRIGQWPFNAGLRSVWIYTAPSVGALDFTTGQVLKSVGNYRDYTDIVKWICAWSAFYWPPHRYGVAGGGGLTGWDYQQLGPGDRVVLDAYAPDPVLPDGSVWGDFMNTGTAGVADLTADLFDKQPLMDCIRYVQDIVGFNFWIDELGGVVWRLPNYWRTGNYLSPGKLDPRPTALNPRGRTSSIIELDTETHLLDYKTTRDSRNLRDRVFVASTDGKTGIVAHGYRPYKVGFRRVAGWTDQHFKDTEECLVMADMIAARQMFAYRKSEARIFGNPAIQVDDQIRIVAPNTGEAHYHYVERISSSLDATTGTWTYDLGTHWLGTGTVEDTWVVDVDQMPEVTKRYLRTMGVMD